MRIKYYFKLVVCLFLFIGTSTNVFAQLAVPFTPRPINGNTNIKVKGDVLMLGNSIVSGAPANNPAAANIPYTGSGNNNSLNGEYIDVDSDNSTYSSSAANLGIGLPCAKIIYAGLYWAAVYPNNRGTNSSSQFIGTPRDEDWNTMKFKIPGGNYINIVADNNPDLNNDTDLNPDDDDDSIIFNGFNYTNINQSFKDAPYVCYKNVTSMFQNGFTDGMCYGANIRATRGIRDGGCAGGWMLVVIYEELSLPSKFISTFDGYAGVQGSVNNVFYDVAGFETLPAPLPVRAKIGVGALEGDRALGGDQCTFKALTSVVAPFPISNTTNLFNNFFNSTISNLDVNVPRIPNSSNTLGFDVDMVNIDNPLNQRVPNSEQNGRITLLTSGDGYGAFFSVFAVDNIAPEIPLLKTVVDSNDNIINNTPLALGQEFYYSLCFENTGNDDAINFTIIDQLPANIIFPVNGTITVGDDLIYDNNNYTDVTHSFDSATNQLTFTVNSNLVEEFDPQFCIKIKVRAPLDCNDVIDACANSITNQAFVFYNGSEGTILDFTDPSYIGTDNCNFPVSGATNFLTNIDLCTFEREEVLCGNSMVLTAANGYSGYTWTYDHDNNPATPAIAYPGGNSQSITISNVGLYYVSMITPAPCISLNEIINVVFFNDATSISNPVIPFADEVAICPNNGEELPKIILCGADDNVFIQTQITSATSIVWQKLLEGSCPSVTITDCANTGTTCVWNQVATGQDYLADTAGQYRIIITYQNGCFRTYYFNVYKNVLNPTITSTDIICNSEGTIIVSNIPVGYQYSLSPTGPWQTEPILNVTSAGFYTVYIQQIGIENGCIFPFPSINVAEKIMDVDIITTNPICNSFGSIRVQVTDVNPQYYYQLLQGTTVINSVGPTSSNNYLFSNVNPGTYTVITTTDDGCTDTQTVTIVSQTGLTLDASVSQNISCTQGNILLNPDGGQTPYDYAIYSYNGVVVNPADYAFQSSVIFDIQIGQQGLYQFIVVDNNNCIALSNIIEITLEPPVNTTETHTNVTCNGLNNGTITVNAAPTNGYNITYSINGAAFVVNNVFTNLAPGNYEIIVKYKKGNRECFYTINVIITQPQPLIGQSQLVQQKTCLVNGTIQAIDVTGGTAPYQYSINGTTFQTSAIFANLNVGTYTIIIRDANNCLFTTQSIEITPAIPPTDLIITAPTLTCPTLVSTITASVVGGTAPFVFQIIAPSIINATTTSGTTATFANLGAGTYTIRVTDSKSCTYQENITIQTINQITLGGNTTSNVQCFGTATGSALFTVGNFNTTYSYTLNGGTAITNQTSTSISLNNLTAGTYTIIVTDSQTNCQAPRSVTIAQPTSALQLTSTFLPITCISSGSINAIATGGWGSYQYTLTQPNGSIVGPQTSGAFGNLTQTGVYTIVVRDANNCVVSNSIAINAITNPDLTLSTNSNLCITNTTNATLTVIATGGTPAYQYQINGGALQSSPTFANLGAGTYTIRVVDSYGCEDSVTQVINPQLTAQAIVTEDLDCTTSPNALITVLINGGQTPYQYQIKFNTGAFGLLNPVTGNTFTYSTAIAGTYQFQITDAQGCVFQTNTITINPLTNPSITSITPILPSCNGFNNGSLTVNINPSLGTGLFQYSLNGSVFQSSNVFNNLVAGSYTITIRDSKNCIDTETIVLTQPLPLLGQSQIVQPITCVITTGTIQATAVSGGTAPYEYSINGVTFVSNPVFAGLGAGTYTITIKDARGCILQTASIILSIPLSPTDITLTASAITCPSLTTTLQATAVGGTAPYAYQIIFPTIINPASTAGNTAVFTNLSVSSATTFIVKVTDANGCVYQKNITIPTIPLIDVIGTVNNNIACLNDSNGQATFTVSGFSANYSYSINLGAVVNNQTNPQIVLSSLGAGTYDILVTDLVTNCTDTASVTILAPSAPLTLSAPFIQPTCNVAGSVNASATGGWGSYQYTLTYPSGTQVTQNSGLFTLLLENINPYTVSVSDANGCVVSQTFTLVPYVDPSIVVDVTNSDLCYDTTNGASIEVIASGGTPSYQYQIQLNGGAFSSLQNNAIFSNLTPGNYTIQVVDNFGCTATVSQVIVPQLLAQAVIIKNLDCSTSPAATINLNITGGTAAYQYQVNFNGTGFGALTNVALNPFDYTITTAGTYQFSITDAAGCNFVTNVITINPITNPIITALTQTTPILCNGNNNATIVTTINTSAGISPFEYSIDGINFQASPIFPSQTAGTYTITVRDNNLCIDTETITINEPPAVDFDIVKTDIICTGTGTQYGIINVENVSGGTQPYTYYLSNNFGLIDQYTAASNENYPFVILNFGIYIVEVVDANGCSLIENNIIIASPPDDLTIDVSTATADCTTGGTAIITVSAPVAVGPYAFAILTQNIPPAFPGPEWVNADAGTPLTATFNGLIPGVTYTFLVLDQTTNCFYFETANAPITTPSTITTTIDIINNVSCTGSANGTVSFSLTNFDPSTTSVNYQVFNAQSNQPTVPAYSGTIAIDEVVESVSNFASLPPGIYYILVTENDGVNDGCTNATTNFQITQSINLLTVTATASNDNCNTNAGIVSAIGQYGTPGYTFIIRDVALAAPLANDPLWNMASSFNVESGNYFVYIKDANGCIQQTPVTVGLDTAPEITQVTVLDPCANEGSFEIQVTRDVTTNIGIPPYTYQVDGGVSFTENAATFTVQNLFSGSHSIRIIDANGCFFDFPFTINQNLSGNTVIIDQPTCVPPNSGSIQVNAVNGTGVYTFSINGSNPATISNGTNTATFTGLVHGSYIIIVDDGNCSIPITVMLEEPNPVDFTIIKQDPTCNGDTNGVIEVQLNLLNDNNPSYTYTLAAPGFTTVTQVDNGLFNTLLGANNYTVTVTSSRGCELTLPIELTDPALLVVTPLTTLNFTCTSSNAAAIITIDVATEVSGGTPNYLYSLDNNFFQTSSIFNFTDTGILQNITIYIKDSNNCTISKLYTINTLPVFNTPTSTALPVLSCTDDEVITISFTGNPTGNYTYQLLPSGVVTPFTGTSFTPAPLTSTGTFTYEIIDTATNCSLLATHTVAPYPVTNVTAQPTIAIDCFGNSNGQLSFTLQNYTGSYNYNVFTSPENISVLTGSSTLATFTTTATLAAGNYYVVINENDYPECTLTSAIITIDSPATALSLGLATTNDSNCGTIGTILATVTGGTAPYQYQLSNAGGIIEAYTSIDNDNFFQNLEDFNGPYTVSVLDANNCSLSNVISVGLDPTPVIELTLVNPCVAEGQFEIEVTRTVDGIAPYTLTVDGATPFTLNTTPYIVTGLLSGLHTIRLTDVNGCFNEKEITILPVLSGTITNTVQPSCDNTDGIIDANATNGSGSYSYILQNNLGVTIAGPNNDGLFTGLGHGDYTVVITDSDPLVSCSVSLEVNLEEPTPVNYTLDVVQPSCNVVNGGIANGSITVNLASTNDNPPYTFTLSDGINPDIVQNNGQFTGLAGSLTAITYTITVESNRGCKKIETILLQTPPELVVLPIVVGQFGCNSNNTPNVITITVPTPTGGTPPYLYSFNGTNFGSQNTFDIIDNSLSQTILVTIKDANSCEISQSVGPINPLIKVDATVSQISALTCGNDEVVEISIIGNSSLNYTYQLLPSTIAIQVTSNPFTTTLSEPGTYNFLITDTTTNCTVITDDYVINPLFVFDVIAIAGNNVSCYAANDGTLSFTITGYSGNFTYDIVDEFGAVYATGNQTNTSITGLIAGSYTVRVSISTTNSYVSCTEISNVITIGTPQELQLVIEQTAATTCTDDQGIITVTSTTGGTGSYQYQLVSLPSGTIVPPYSFSAISEFTGLASGDYTVIVQDANLCQTTQNINLAPALPITASFTITNQNLSCFNGNNASVTVNSVTGGQGSYQYTLTYPDGTVAGPQIGLTFSGLSAGVGYYITVLDGWNCDEPLTPFTINQPTPLQASLALERDLTCDITPQVEITASGGTPPYFVNGLSFNSTIILNAIMPATGNGVFQYTVTDSGLNCTPVQTSEIVIEPIAPIVIELQSNTINVNCAGEDNAVIIVENTTGGQGNYVYQLQDAAGNTIGLSNTTGLFFNIAGSIIPGETYYVYVTSGDCEHLSSAILVTEPVQLNAPIVTKKDVSCFGNKDGEVTITISGGVQPYQFAVSPNLSQTIDPVNPNTITITGLGSGSFTILYQDANGCFDTVSVNIIEPSGLVFFQPTVVSPKCDGESGSLSITASGGTPPYQFSFDGDANYISTGSNTYTNNTTILGGQEYEIYIKDANGCITNAVIQTTPTVDLSSTFVANPNCDTQTYSIEVFIDDNLLPTTQFSLDNQTNYQDSNVFTNVTPGSHVIFIKNDNGCIQQTQNITVDPFLVLELTAIESPDEINQIIATATGGTEPYTYIFNGNNTGNNNVYVITYSGQQTITVIDTNDCERTVLLPATFYEIEIPNYFTPDQGWTPENINNFDDLVTKVFDRYGREVVLLRNGEKWFGNYNGNPLPTGDYWYLIEVNDGTGRTFVGNVTLYR